MREPDSRYSVGDSVHKSSGDYRFRGVVVAKFSKRSGVTRYVVENSDGMLFIFNDAQLHVWDGKHGS
jgi:putative ribosome biogenesis GTPase RsgA